MKRDMIVEVKNSKKRLVNSPHPIRGYFGDIAL